MDGVKLNAIDVTRPEAGVYPDLPADVYHALDCASSSRLNKLARSPAHCRHAIDNPGEQTPALAFGEAFHLCCLQPDLFRDRYVVSPQVDRRTKDGKAEWAAFQAANVGRELIGQDELDRCFAMTHAVLAHPAARLLLESRTATELSAVWECRTTGVRCKLRADGIADLAGIGAVALDVKTTEDASPATFERSIFNYGYHRQGAHYLDGLAALDRPFEAFCLIAVEKQPPHAVAVYRLLDEAIAIGRDELVPLLRRYGECQRTGVWPGYGDDYQDIGLPRWAMRDAGAF